MMAAALAYARAGFPVFPCRETAQAAKTPYVPQGFKAATSDVATVQGWWAEWPRALIGFPTGPASRTLVIDLDPKALAADEMLRAVRRAVGGRLAAAELPAIAKTQGGGLHLYYGWPDGSEITIGVNLFPDILQVDWRGAGGYVIAPPSRMDSGAAYEWILRPAREGLNWRLPAPPAALLERIEAKRRKRLAVVAPPAEAEFRPVGEGRVAKYVKAAVDNILAESRGAPEGARSDTVYACALKLGNFVRGGQISRSEAQSLLLGNLPRGVSPGERKIQQTIARGLDSGKDVFSPRALAS